MKFIHISDLHYHREPVNNLKADALPKTVGNRYPEHRLIVSGIETDDGHPERMEAAQQSAGLNIVSNSACRVGG